MENQVAVFHVGVLKEAVDPVGVEEGGEALHAVDVVAFFRRNSAAAVLAVFATIVGSFEVV